MRQKTRLEKLETTNTPTDSAAVVISRAIIEADGSSGGVFLIRTMREVFTRHNKESESQFFARVEFGGRWAGYRAQKLAGD